MAALLTSFTAASVSAVAVVAGGQWTNEALIRTTQDLDGNGSRHQEQAQEVIKELRKGAAMGAALVGVSSGAWHWVLHRFLVSRPWATRMSPMLRGAKVLKLGPLAIVLALEAWWSSDLLLDDGEHAVEKALPELSVAQAIVFTGRLDSLDAGDGPRVVRAPAWRLAPSFAVAMSARQASAMERVMAGAFLPVRAVATAVTYAIAPLWVRAGVGAAVSAMCLSSQTTPWLVMPREAALWTGARRPGGGEAGRARTTLAVMRRQAEGLTAWELALAVEAASEVAGKRVAVPIDELAGSIPRWAEDAAPSVPAELCISLAVLMAELHRAVLEAAVEAAEDGNDEVEAILEAREAEAAARGEAEDALLDGDGSAASDLELLIRLLRAMPGEFESLTPDGRGGLAVVEDGDGIGLDRARLRRLLEHLVRVRGDGLSDGPVDLPASFFPSWGTDVDLAWMEEPAEGLVLRADDPAVADDGIRGAMLGAGRREGPGGGGGGFRSEGGMREWRFDDVIERAANIPAIGPDGIARRDGRA